MSGEPGNGDELNLVKFLAGEDPRKQKKPDGTIEDLKAHLAGEDPRKQRPVNPPKPPAPPGHITPYAQAAVDNECAELESMPPNSGRIVRLHLAAFNLGSLILAGHVEEQYVRDRLIQACHRNGVLAEDGQRECDRNITNGFNGAAAKVGARDIKPLESSTMTVKPAHTLELPAKGDLADSEENEGGGAVQYTAAELREFRINHRMEELAVQREAKHRLDKLERPPVELPATRSLTAFLETEYSEPEYLIDRIHPYGGNVLSTGPYKAGKTTLRDNAIRALVDGGQFLGRYTVNHTANALVVIDLEMSETQLWRWLRRSGIRNTDRVADVISLQGRGHMLDLRDDTTRAMWVDKLKAVGCDYLVVDCLRPILDALGLNENSEATLWLNAFDRLRAEAGIEAGGMVLHHHGHGTDRGRGDSGILGWYTAEWKVTRVDKDDVASPRQFSANGRDVDEPPRALEYDDTTRTLTLGDGTVKDAERQAAVEADAAKLLHALAEAREDGLGYRAARDVLGDNSGRLNAARDLLKARQQITVEDGGKGKPKVHRIAHPCEVCWMPLSPGLEGTHRACAEGAETGSAGEIPTRAESAAQEVFEL